MQKFYVGIDIGTYHVKVVIAAPNHATDQPLQILGTGTATSRGMRHGYIIDVHEVSQVVREAVDRAAGAAKVKVVSARVAVSGIGLDEVRSGAEVSLTTSGGVIALRDMERAVKESEKRSAAKLINRTVVHAIPLEYRIDGTKILGRPEGVQGTKLAVDTLLVTMLTKHHDDLLDAVERAGIEVEGVMASPIAASFVTLTKAQKTAGVVLANIGSETFSIIVYDNDIPVSMRIFPIGASHITERIALDFQIPLIEAEQAKRGALLGGTIPDKKIQAIVNSSMKEMFAQLQTHLKSINRQRLLPAGIVLTGGGSSATGVADIARNILKLPSQVGAIGLLTRSTVVDATWTVAYGLCRWAYAEDKTSSDHSFAEVLQDGWDSLKSAIQSLLP